MPLENTKAEPLATASSKEKYVFVVKTFDKANAAEKNFILKAKSTMDMNGWVFAINSQAFVCTENKRILELDQNLRRHERKNCEQLKETFHKFMAHFEDFLQAPRVRERIIKATADKTHLLTKFSFIFNLLELYFKAREPVEEALDSQETLFKTLSQTLESAQAKRPWLESKGYKITVIEEEKGPGLPSAESLSREVALALDLGRAFSKKYESFQEKGFWEEFETILKPRILDFLRKAEEMKRILVGVLEKARNPGFERPVIADLRKSAGREGEGLAVARREGKRRSQVDLLCPPNSSLQNSMVSIGSLFRSNADLNK